jgi:tRNA dimethylallyltransferase
MTKTIEVITGPTASGKTALALRRAEENTHIVIVNADASLFYKGFDIGTAKPSKEIRNKIEHYLIDVLNPEQSTNAAEYASNARNIIRENIAKGRIPIVVGGTGLYIDALFFGLSRLEVDNTKIVDARSRVASEMHEFGFDEMLARLEKIDPDMHEQIARELNPRRLERAWEYYYASGLPLGKARKDKSEPFEFSPVFTILEVEREELRKRISERTDEMLASGWLNEVERLLASGVTVDMPAMNAIGYKELAAVLRNEKKLEEAREEIIISTRQYAKRQETWMKRYKKITYEDQTAFN